MTSKEGKTMKKPDTIEEVSDGDLKGIEKLKIIITKRGGEKIGTEHDQTFAPIKGGGREMLTAGYGNAIPANGDKKDGVLQTSTNLFPEKISRTPIKPSDEKSTEETKKEKVPKTVENPKPKQNLLGRLLHGRQSKTVPTTEGVTPMGKKKDGFGYGDLNIANITADTVYDDETYVGRPEKPKEHETYILNQQNKSHKMNKITSTKVGDEIRFFVNGKEDIGVISKMTNSYVTIFKADGKFYDILINDTFFVKDILINKTWNDMDEYERTELLQKAHVLSPRYLLKTWEELPQVLKDVIKSKTKIKSDVERGAYGGISTETAIDATDDYEGQTHEGTRKEQFDYEEKKPEVLHKEEGVMSSDDSGVMNEVYGKKRKIKAGEFVYTEHSEYKTNKFNVNPNSFGIKYMTKEEQQEWAKKERKESKKLGLGSASDVDTSLLKD